MHSLNRRRLGKTNLMVTELGFGAMNLRKMRGFEQARELVRFVIESGVNFIDTARAYKGEISSGVELESERVLGEVISSMPKLPEPLVIVSKCHGYTVGELREYLTVSRDTLGVKGTHTLTIGENEVKLIYFLHGISTERWEVIRTSGVLEELKHIKEEGLVSFTGFSSHYAFPAEIKLAADTGAFDVVELPYNAYNRSLGEDGAFDLLKYLHDKDLGVINMKAFDGNGMVPLYPIVKEFVDISYPDMLHFCLSNPYISTVDAGATSIEQFSEDIKVALDTRWDVSRREALTVEADKISGFMKHSCRECMHCVEKFSCPNGVDFPRVVSLYSRRRFSSALGKPVGELTEQLKEMGGHIDTCSECGACLEWCEYRLDIPKMIKDAGRSES